LTDYPVMMRLAGRRCVVVGGGAVGLRKLRGLVAAGADVLLVDPAPAGPLPDGVAVRRRRFAADDLDGASLVFAATDEKRVNRDVVVAARERGLPVNVADDPDNSDFTLPATFFSGGLSVAVATDGLSPAVAALVRDDLERLLSPAWSIFLEIAAILRRRQLTSESPAAYNLQVLQNLLNKRILQLIEAADAAGVDRLLEAECGQGCSLAELGVSLSKGLK